jgi:hypothetical protein
MVNNSFGARTLQNPRGVLLNTEATILYAFASYRTKGSAYDTDQQLSDGFQKRCGGSPLF